MQADEVLYLYPDRSRLPGPAIDVDEDPLPEMVLEVDHTTDVRRRKLETYKESGFPEIWVLVPWEASVRAPGLTIQRKAGSSPGGSGSSASCIPSCCNDAVRREGLEIGNEREHAAGRCPWQGGEDHQFSRLGVVISPESWIINFQMGRAGVSGLVRRVRAATTKCNGIRKLHGHPVANPIGVN